MSESTTFPKVLRLSILLHIGFLAYGYIQDLHPVIKFTDIDYLVFTDGARSLSQGLSPYLRATYRYPPLLAFLLLPNVLVHPLYGKLLFTLADVAVGWFIYSILLTRGMKAD